jgi:ubiquitin-protein ligase
MMNGEWSDVGLSGLVSSETVDTSLTTFLESKGLGKHAHRIVDATDAESVDDLKLLDTPMVEAAIAAAGLRLVSAQKFRLLVAELRGDVAPPTSSRPAEEISPLAPGADLALENVPSPGEPNGGPVDQVPPQPQECVAICIDRSGSMGAPFAEATVNVVQGVRAERTRMEAVKAMFYAFRDRAESLDTGSHQLGLVQFDNQVERLLDVTPQLNRFEAILDDMQKRGQTAIYSAIIEAADMLRGHFREDSQTDLRILALTDGQNNAGARPEEALAAANQIGAVVDAIVVGDRPDADLRRIVTATGGECYQIGDLGEGFELLEAEGVVSLRARRGGAEKPPFCPRETVDFASLSEKALTRGTAVQRASTQAPSLAATPVVHVSSIGDGAAALASGGSGSTRRILMELKQVSTGADGVWLHSGDGVHVFPAADNIRFWRALVEGPPASPFEGGVFALSVVIPENYPFKAPQITFETPVYHCNVSDSGKICLGILQDNWSPSLSVPKCLEAIRAMLRHPDTDNSLRQWIAELTLAHQKTNGADTRYHEKASESTRQDASLTVSGWRQKWGC